MKQTGLSYDLGKLDQLTSLSQKLRFLHESIRGHYESIHHISVTIYDPQTDLLKTYLDSSLDRPALVNYQANLAQVPSLLQLAQTGASRVISELHDYSNSQAEHTRRNLATGYRSSYTLPMFLSGDFYGFIFFDSCKPDYFQPDTLAHLDPLGRLLSLFVINEIRAIRTLIATTKTARHVTSRRDCETGAHLERMSRYCRLIARELAPKFGLNDEYIEHLFLFSPLHDIGKIAMPDSILLKPGPLSVSEFEVMKTHTAKGLEMVDYMLEEFALNNLPHTELLRNLVYSHHEAVDGSGYPAGLRAEEIPLEARIVTTADIFDALTSQRPYKPAWDNDKAFAHLLTLVGNKLDPNCVDALIKHRPTVERLQQQFQETEFG